MLADVASTLKRDFPTSPPHTGQRLAELILQPRLSYQTSPAYLRALSRVVTVASPLSAFPLPAMSDSDRLATNGNINVISEGAHKHDDNNASGGGAELTEIPWLKQQDATTDDHPLTSGLQSPRAASNSDTIPGDAASDVSDDAVHARGPSLIGVEDMGPQPEGSGLETGLATVTANGPEQPMTNHGIPGEAVTESRESAQEAPQPPENQDAMEGVETSTA